MVITNCNQPKYSLPVGRAFDRAASFPMVNASLYGAWPLASFGLCSFRERVLQSRHLCTDLHLGRERKTVVARVTLIKQVPETP
jgi:hypothetical protein